MFGCVCVVHVFWMKWFVFPITSSCPSPQCDFLINTFPLAFVCPLLFSFSAIRVHALLSSCPCSMSSCFSSSTLMFSSFSLSATPADALCLRGQKSNAQERFASKTAGEWPLLTEKTTNLLGFLKVQQCSKGNRQGPCDNIKEEDGGGGWLAADTVLIMQRSKTCEGSSLLIYSLLIIVACKPQLAVVRAGWRGNKKNRFWHFVSGWCKWVHVRIFGVPLNFGGFFFLTYLH